ncbi:MAG: hypothetical protein ACREMV_10705 [Gemmatimonadales bacterium]
MALTRCLLNTSAYAALLRGHRDGQRALQRVDRIVLTPVVLGELRAGFVRGGRRAKHEAELARFRESPRVDVVDVAQVIVDFFDPVSGGRFSSPNRSDRLLPGNGTG